MTEISMLPDIELELELGGRVETGSPDGGGEQMVREVVEQILAERLDHRALAGRECENQHPVAAVEGLRDQLRRIPAPAEAMTNFELEELLR